MNDNIFLLSTEEYEKYKERIPQINCWWWLRSAGRDTKHTAVANPDGCTCDVYGDPIENIFCGVRPALRIACPEKYNFQIGKRIIRYDFPWIMVDKDLAIAEVPIAFRRFSKESNDYEISEIRKFLLEWVEEVE